MSKTKQAYTGTPEVTPVSVVKKGTGPPTNGRVKVTHKTERRGKLWLRTFVAGVLVADMAWGMTGIYHYFDGSYYEYLRPHAMWTFAVVHAGAILTVFFHKLE